MTQAAGTGSRAPSKRARGSARPCSTPPLPRPRRRRPDAVGRARPGGAEPRASGDEGGERTFGVDRAAAVEDAPPVARLDAHRDLARHGVDVPEQHHDARRGRVAELRHRVAGVVDEGAVVAERRRLLGEPGRGFLLFARERADANQAGEERDRRARDPSVLHPFGSRAASVTARGGGHSASTAAMAVTARSICSRSMTSAGRRRITVGPAWSADHPCSRIRRSR